MMEFSNRLSAIVPAVPMELARPSLSSLAKAAAPVETGFNPGLGGRDGGDGPVGFFELSPQRGIGRLLLVNPSFASMVGVFPADAALLSLFDFIHPADTCLFVEKLGALPFSMAGIRIQTAREEERLYEVSCQALLFDGRRIGIARIQRSARRMRSVRHNWDTTQPSICPLAVMTLEAERLGGDSSRSRIHYVNDRAAGIFGYSVEELKAQARTKTFAELLLTPEGRRKHDKAVRENLDAGTWPDDRYNVALPVVHRSGLGRTVRFSNIGRYPAKEGRVYFTALLNDITYQKEMEELNAWIADLSDIEESDRDGPPPDGPRGNFDYDSFSQLVGDIRSPDSGLMKAIVSTDQGVFVQLRGKAAARLAFEHQHRLHAAIEWAIKASTFKVQADKHVTIELVAATDPDKKFIIFEFGEGGPQRLSPTTIPAPPPLDEGPPDSTPQQSHFRGKD